MSSKEYEISDDSDLNRLRDKLRSLAEECEFSSYESTKLVTAAGEIFRNVLEYAGKGWVTLEISENDPPGIGTVVWDEGPGIEDVNQAMEDGYRGENSNGLGVGLPGAKRLADEFEIDSTHGDGTRVMFLVRKDAE